MAAAVLDLSFKLGIVLCPESCGSCYSRTRAFGQEYLPEGPPSLAPAHLRRQK
jgi:hypothetical protein